MRSTFQKVYSIIQEVCRYVQEIHSYSIQEVFSIMQEVHSHIKEVSNIMLIYSKQEVRSSI